MLNFSEATIEKVVVHKVGNKLKEEGFNLSKTPVELHEDIKPLLQTYFLNTFKKPEYYHFTHSSELELNEIFNYSGKVFADPDAFFLQTINITKHLYEQSSHPNIRSGEFYCVYFTGITTDEETVDAIGLFKSETKETYLKVFPKDDAFEILYEDGININKLDKGCLILNCEKEKGYKVCIIDNLNKSNEAQYWKDDFLNLKPREDNYFHTKQYLKLCQDFISVKFTEDFEVSKADQIDLINKSTQFFKKKENFDFNTFTEEVIQQPEVVESFKEFKKQYQEENDFFIADEFEISMPAVKKQARVYKSVLKLDKNFHVYIHGNRERIVKGFDEETGLNYYQLFFKEES